MNLKLYQTTHFSFMGHHINPGSCSYAEEFVIFSCCGISIHKERGAKILHDVFSSRELGQVHYDSPGVRHCMQNKFGAFYTREEGNTGTEPWFSLSCAGAHIELVSGRASLSDSCFSLCPSKPRVVAAEDPSCRLPNITQVCLFARVFYCLHRFIFVATSFLPRPYVDEDFCRSYM